MEIKKFSTEIGGKTLIAEFSDLADQADGSVRLQYGDTVVFATAVMSDNIKEGLGYFPLSVEFEEKFYAAGKILGSRFIRREGRPTEEAVLSGRVVDRTIRPLFDGNIRNEIQVVTTVLSIGEDDPDVLAVNAASLAVATSNIPWNGPVSAVRIAKSKDGVDIVNPTYSERENAEYQILACGKDGNINMIETESFESSETDIADAFQRGIDEIEKLQEFQKNIIKEIGKEKREIKLREFPTEFEALFADNFKDKLPGAVCSNEPGKKTIGTLRNEWVDFIKEQEGEFSSVDAGDYYEELVNNCIHEQAVENDKRADGRDMKTVRPLFAKAGDVSPMAHGTGIFYRGGTHVLAVLTLAGPDDSQVIDSIEGDSKKRFIHHYNFPPFSVGETGRIGGFNRRMIGHGALAEKALSAVVPSEADFPYTIRLVSESMASNGSTSMGSVCASTIAMMDGGVPIKNPVAGIAMGLMMEGDKYKVLTDIQGPEDHHGDMDFKVAGTKDGITAIQMDVKVDGIPLNILKEALEDAKTARLHILETITAEINEPRADLKDHAPYIESMKINPDDIGSVIGSGGKTINGIKDSTGVESISIEDDGSIFITGIKTSVVEAKQIIEDMTRKYTAGEKFDGTVTKITDFGAFVRINAFSEGLVHISEIAPFRVEKVSDFLKEGGKVPVVIKGVDEKDRIALSIKEISPDLFKDKAPKN